VSAVLTTGSAVRCSEGGTVAVEGRDRLTVDGAGVLRLDGVQGKGVSAACATVPDSSKGLVKCTSVTSASGQAAKLLVDGAPVALETLSGTTNGTNPSPATVSASAGQTRLTAG